jgi:FAD/FMN-containing dehydrogenase
VSHLSLDHDVRFAHARDASGLELVPESVARPSSVEELEEILK